ncbi:MAG: hypothetical protein EA385_00385 [Salinarimonadaceae bacterium]|nr:MAG: hypothetical protein EA385_00385 [Salinarimonadaceae bacterium]
MARVDQDLSLRGGGGTALGASDAASGFNGALLAQGLRTYQGRLYGGTVTATPTGRPGRNGQTLWQVTARTGDGRTATVNVYLTGQFGPDQLRQGSATKRQLDAAINAQAPGNAPTAPSSASSSRSSAPSSAPSAPRTYEGRLYGGTVTAIPVGAPSSSGQTLWEVTARTGDGRTATVRVALTGQFGDEQLRQGSATKRQLDAAIAAQAPGNASSSTSSSPSAPRTYEGRLYGGTVTAIPVGAPSSSGQTLWEVTARTGDGRTATVRVALTGQFGDEQLRQGSATKRQLDAALAAQQAERRAQAGYSTFEARLFGGGVTAVPSERDARGNSNWTVTWSGPEGSFSTQARLAGQFGAAQLTDGSYAKNQLGAQILAARARNIPSSVSEASFRNLGMDGASAPVAAELYRSMRNQGHGVAQSWSGVWRAYLEGYASGGPGAGRRSLSTTVPNPPSSGLSNIPPAEANAVVAGGGRIVGQPFDVQPFGNSASIYQVLNRSGNYELRLRLNDPQQYRQSDFLVFENAGRPIDMSQDYASRLADGVGPIPNPFRTVGSPLYSALNDTLNQALDRGNRAPQTGPSGTSMSDNAAVRAGRAMGGAVRAVTGDIAEALGRAAPYLGADSTIMPITPQSLEGQELNRQITAQTSAQIGDSIRDVNDALGFAMGVPPDSPEVTFGRLTMGFYQSIKGIFNLGRSAHDLVRNGSDMQRAIRNMNIIHRFRNPSSDELGRIVSYVNRISPDEYAAIPTNVKTAMREGLGANRSAPGVQQALARLDNLDGLSPIAINPGAVNSATPPRANAPTPPAAPTVTPRPSAGAGNPNPGNAAPTRANAPGIAPPPRRPALPPAGPDNLSRPALPPAGPGNLTRPAQTPTGPDNLTRPAQTPTGPGNLTTTPSFANFLGPIEGQAVFQSFENGVYSASLGDGSPPFFTSQRPMTRADFEQGPARAALEARLDYGSGINLSGGNPPPPPPIAPSGGDYTPAAEVLNAESAGSGEPATDNIGGGANNPPRNPPVSLSPQGPGGGGGNGGANNGGMIPGQYGNLTPEQLNSYRLPAAQRRGVEQQLRQIYRENLSPLREAMDGGDVTRQQVEHGVREVEIQVARGSSVEEAISNVRAGAEFMRAGSPGEASAIGEVSAADEASIVAQVADNLPLLPPASFDAGVVRPYGQRGVNPYADRLDAIPSGARASFTEEAVNPRALRNLVNANATPMQDNTIGEVIGPLNPDQAASVSNYIASTIADHGQLTPEGVANAAGVQIDATQTEALRNRLAPANDTFPNNPLLSRRQFDIVPGDQLTESEINILTAVIRGGNTHTYGTANANDGIEANLRASNHVVMAWNIDRDGNRSGFPATSSIRPNSDYNGRPGAQDTSYLQYVVNGGRIPVQPGDIQGSERGYVVPGAGGSTTAAAVALANAHGLPPVVAYNTRPSAVADNSVAALYNSLGAQFYPGEVPGVDGEPGRQRQFVLFGEAEGYAPPSAENPTGLWAGQPIQRQLALDPQLNADGQPVRASVTVPVQGSGSQPGQADMEIMTFGSEPLPASRQVTGAIEVSRDNAGNITGITGSDGQPRSFGQLASEYRNGMITRQTLENGGLLPPEVNTIIRMAESDPRSSLTPSPTGDTTQAVRTETLPGSSNPFLQSPDQPISFAIGEPGAISLDGMDGSSPIGRQLLAETTFLSPDSVLQAGIRDNITRPFAQGVISNVLGPAAFRTSVAPGDATPLVPSDLAPSTDPETANSEPLANEFDPVATVMVDGQPAHLSFGRPIAPFNVEGYGALGQPGGPGVPFHPLQGLADPAVNAARDAVLRPFLANAAAPHAISTARLPDINSLSSEDVDPFLDGSMISARNVGNEPAVTFGTTGGLTLDPNNVIAPENVTYSFGDAGALNVPSNMPPFNGDGISLRLGFPTGLIPQGPQFNPFEETILGRMSQAPLGAIATGGRFMIDQTGNVMRAGTVGAGVLGTLAAGDIALNGLQTTYNLTHSHQMLNIQRQAQSVTYHAENFPVGVTLWADPRSHIHYQPTLPGSGQAGALPRLQQNGDLTRVMMTDIFRTNPVGLLMGESDGTISNIGDVLRSGQVGIGAFAGVPELGWSTTIGGTPFIPIPGQNPMNPDARVPLGVTYGGNPARATISSATGPGSPHNLSVGQLASFTPNLQFNVQQVRFGPFIFTSPREINFHTAGEWQSDAAAIRRGLPLTDGSFGQASFGGSAGNTIGTAIFLNNGWTPGDFNVLGWGNRLFQPMSTETNAPPAPRVDSNPGETTPRP